MTGMPSLCAALHDPDPAAGPILGEEFLPDFRDRGIDDGREKGDSHHLS